MELAFNVSAGPLTQVALPIISLESAVHLAVGLYGWYKARERTDTLEQTLRVRGASFAPASTFNRQHYRNVRLAEGGVHASAIDPGRQLVRLPLPRASTAISEDAGFECIRAIIVGLSCFLSRQQTHDALKELLPKYLLHYDQYDSQKPLEGPSLRALADFVGAVFAEEYIDKLRGYLFDFVDSQLASVTGASLRELQSSHSVEMSQIIGVLSWVLTPKRKRDRSVYRTRSLKVWSLCLILGELGFEVEASRKAINTLPTGDIVEIGLEDCLSSSAEVILILSPGWPTDPGAHPLQYKTVPICSQPRIATYRAFPALAFADICQHIPSLDADTLDNIFILTYQRSRQFFRCYTGIIQAAQLPDEQLVQPDQFDAPDPQFLDLLPQMAKDVILQYISFSQYMPGAGALSGKTLERFLQDHLAEWIYILMGPELKADAIMTIIQIPVFAFVLSFVDLFVRRDGDVTDWLDSKFVYVPTAVYESRNFSIPLVESFPSPRIFSMATLVAQTARHIATDFVDSAYSGLRQPRVWTHRREKVGTLVSQAILGSSQQFTKWEFGIQSCGMVAVSEFLIRPSLTPNSLLLYHLQIGQPIDFPIYNQFIVDGEAYEEGYDGRPKVERFLTKVLGDPHALTTTSERPNIPPENWLRWDFEPCWEADPRTCCVNLRVDGLPRIQLGIYELTRAAGKRHELGADAYSFLSPCLLHASGGQSKHDTTSADRQRARIDRDLCFGIPLMDMILESQLGISDVQPRRSGKGAPNWIVHVGKNDMMALVATCVALANRVYPRCGYLNYYITDCILAGLEMAEEDMLKGDSQQQADFRFMLIITGDYDDERTWFK